MLMYQRLIEEYLTHDQPELKSRLIGQQTLQTYLDGQATAMLSTRQEVLAQLAEQYPQMSQTQRELEADQTVRELFLPLP